MLATIVRSHTTQTTDGVCSLCAIAAAGEVANCERKNDEQNT